MADIYIYIYIYVAGLVVKLLEDAVKRNGTPFEAQIRQKPVVLLRYYGLFTNLEFLGDV